VLNAGAVPVRASAAEENSARADLVNFFIFITPLIWRLNFLNAVQLRSDYAYI
jgi:hypothetical protein